MLRGPIQLKFCAKLTASRDEKAGDSFQHRKHKEQHLSERGPAYLKMEELNLWAVACHTLEGVLDFCTWGKCSFLVVLPMQLWLWQACLTYA